MTTVIRPCKVCGLFYPQDPGELRAVVGSLLEQVPPVGSPDRVVGLVSPHAGYVYSGLTASHGFSLLRDVPMETVVIVSPSHREYFDGISVYAGDGYETPLGIAHVDTELRRRLLDALPLAKLSEAGHRDEHAIEVQIPFLQFVRPGVAILPIVIGDQRREYCTALGEALASVLDLSRHVLLASTDLSHYHSYEEAGHLDNVVIQDICSFDPDALMDHLEEGAAEACGGGPTVAVMVALRGLGAIRMKILHYCNSGDVTGERRQVVGYLSAAAYA